MGSLSRAELEAMVAEAVVDAYDDDEQLTGLYTMIADNLAVPFTTEVPGVEVTVRRIDLNAGGIIAVCHRGRLRQAIGIGGSAVAGPAAGGRAVDRGVPVLGVGRMIAAGGGRAR